MAGNSNIIREYLVSLGWKIDESGQRKFATAIAVQTVALQELAKGLEEVAEKAVSFVARISDELEKLYFASQRTKASAQNIQAFGFAAGQMGSSVEGATASLENLARFMRTRPAGENYIQGLGVRTRQTNGELRDTTDILQDLGKKFADMPQFRAQRLADILGIDEKTMFALREGVGQFSGQYLEMLKAVGMDSQSAAKSSHELMNGLRTLGAMATILSNKVAAALGARLKKPLDDLQKWFLSRLPAIGKVVDSLADGFGLFVEAIARFAQMVGSFVGGVIDWFRRLDPAARQLIATAGALAAALWLLSSPLALIGAVAAAIFLLIDDYQTWRRGGKSLINWSQWDDEIQKAVAGIQDVVAKITDLITFLGKLEQKLANFIKPENILGTLPKEIGDLIDLLDALTSRDWGKIKISAKRIMADENFKGFKDDRTDFAGLERRDHLPAGITDAVYAAESNRGKNLISPKGARGPFQFMPKTAEEFGLQGNDVFDLAKSAEAFGQKMAGLLNHYGGNIAKALAAYNWGEGNLDKYGMDAAPKETQDYVRKVLGNMNVPTSNPYSREQVARAAGATTSTADNSKQVVVHQTNTTTIHGSSDPAAMAKQNDRSKSANNEILIRQLLPALQ